MKKVLMLVIVITAVCVLTACSDSSANTSQETTISVTDATLQQEVSIPTDSGLADSIFDDVAIPTEAVNNTTSDVTEENNLESSDSATEATAPDTKPEDMTYEAFTALTPEEQRLYQESFGDLDAFFAWYTAAKDKYEKENPPIEIDGPIDLGKV